MRGANLLHLRITGGDNGSCVHRSDDRAFDRSQGLRLSESRDGTGERVDDGRGDSYVLRLTRRFLISVGGVLDDVGDGAGYR